METPLVSFLLGALFLVAGGCRGSRMPAGSLTAGAGRYVFGFIGVLLLCNSIYLLTH